MTRVFCDSCGKKLPEDYSGDAYGYDWCGNKHCEEVLLERCDEPLSQRKKKTKKKKK